MRTRFAPSPTGFLHIGNLRTVLFDYLAAKSMRGKLILRIEDTDQKREVEGAIEKLIEILQWVGIFFDEGPNIGGSFGPYIQSHRKEIYQKYINELLEKGGAYKCFCSAERLENMRLKQQNNKLPPRYDRACRNLTEIEIQKKINNREKYVIRQKMPLNGEIIVYDEIKGSIKFNCSELDDHVLVKSDGTPTYQFASVIDDHLMHITHVLRGDEWISSFPKNILLYQAFDWQPPIFAHIPLVLNKTGGKLSKRQSDVTVEEYRQKGYLPEALLNFCVLLGWHPKNENEILSLEDMIKEFNIKDIGASPVIFDKEKLDYFNGYYIRQKNVDELTNLILPYLIKDNLIKKNDNKIEIIATKEIKTIDYIKQIVHLEQERIKKLSDITEIAYYFFVKNIDYQAQLLIWKKCSYKETSNNLQKIFELLEKIPENEWTKHSVKDMIIGHIEATGGKNGDYLWPFRVCLSGKEGSPGPFEIAGILGKKHCLNRIVQAIEKIKNL